MIWLESSHGDTDCNLSDMRNSIHHKEIHHLNIVGNCDSELGESSSSHCTPQYLQRDYGFFPQSELSERLGDPSDSMRGHYEDQRSLSLLSSGSDKTNVSIYENLSQTSSSVPCQYSSEMKDLHSMSSDLVCQQKLEDSKTTMIGMYIIDKTIGKGNFSVVKLATHKSTQVKVAIKIIDKTRLTAENLEKIRREVQIMKHLHHPHIVRLYQVMESDTMIYIVMEFVPNGEIFDYVASQRRFKEDEARQLFFQIVSAIEYCHDRGIVHRDLKAENLLLDDQMNIKLADFGFGNYWHEGLLLNTFCGSPPYAAPEIFKGERYNGAKADIWSLGVVLYVLVTGSLPFEDRTLALLKERVVQAKFRIPFWMSDACEDLLRNMLCRAPERRLTIRQILGHRWLRRASEFGNCPPAPCLAEDMTKQIFNEQILSIMELKGMSRKQIVQSLSSCAYDHRTALYLLLGEKMRRRVRGSMPEDNLAAPAAMMQRRPSSVAESLMVNRGGVPQGKELQQSPPQIHPPSPQQHLLTQRHSNVIDAMQTTSSRQQPQHQQHQQHHLQQPSTALPCHSVSGMANAWPQQLSAQMQSMAISPPSPSRSHAMTISFDVTSTSPSSPGGGRCRPHHSYHHHYSQYHHYHHPHLAPHHHQPQRYHRHHHHHHHQPDTDECCLSGQAPPPQQHRLHPAWAPNAVSPSRLGHRAAVPTAAGDGGGGPVAQHHFNEGRRASDVGLLTSGCPAMRLEAPFAPLAARAAGVFNLVARGAAGDSLEAELAALSGLEAVDFVQASQMPSSPSAAAVAAAPPDHMQLDLPPQHRRSLPVACAHGPEDGAGEGRGGRACCQLPTIVSAPPDEEGGVS